MKKRLRVEELEERIAPTVIPAGGGLTFTDSNGDEITIEYDDVGTSQIEVLDTLGGDINNGDDIGSITFSGANAASQLQITSNGAGGNDIVIDDGIYAPGQDIGSMYIGYAEGEDFDGDVVLGNGFSINIGGSLGVLLVDGEIDFDTAGHSITTSGDLGTAFFAAVHLDSGSGLADIEAGAGGTGDISFLIADAVYEGSGTGTPMAGTPFTTTAVVADDVGDGTIGTLTLKLSGPAPAGEYWAIPVVGGGSVLALVEVTSPDALLTITSGGAGGDVTEVDFAAAAKGLSVAGTGDTDVLAVIAEDSVDLVANKTSYGDIGLVDVAGGGDLGLLQTGKMGVFGTVFTGLRNEYPIFSSFDVGGSVVDGTVEKIQVGAMIDTSFEAGSFGSINVGPGQIMYADIMTDGDIDQIKAQSICCATIEALGEIGTVSANGINWVNLWGYGGIGSVSVKGLMAGVSVSAHTTDIGGSPVGAGIGSVSADAMVGVSIEAVGDVGKVTVKGAFWDSGLQTRWWDPNLAAYVGGGISSFQVGGMYDSDVESLDSINTVKIGKGGMLYASSVLTDGDINSLQVQGDVDDSDINVEGSANTIKIGGDFSNSSGLEAASVNSLTVSGAVWDSQIQVYGGASKVSLGSMIGHDSYFEADTVGSFSVARGVMGDGEEIIDIDTFGSLSIKGEVYWADIVFVDGGKLALGRGASYVEIGGNSLEQFSSGNLVDFGLYIDDDLGSMKVNGSLMYTDIEVGGDAGLVSVGGDMIDTDLELTGPTAAGVSIKGDVYYTDIDVGESGGTATDAGTLSIGGSILYSDLYIYGPTDKIAVKGSWLESDIDAEDVVGQLTVGKSMNDADIESDVAFGPVSIGGNLNYASISADGGLDNITVKGNMLNVEIDARDYDGAGHPIHVNIGNISATKIWDTSVEATGNLGMVTAKTIIAESYFSTAARDNYGIGDEVSGGSIAGVKAAGLIDTGIDSWGDIGKITLGSYGVINGSAIATLGGGDFLGLTTRGLMLGEINVSGDVNGSILTGGADAVFYDGVYLFTDANGTYTGGILFVDGVVAPGVVIS